MRIQREIRRRACQTSFLTWCEEALVPYGQVPERHHRLLIRELEDIESGANDRLMVFMPPGSAKSTYASVLFPPWFLARRKNRDMIGASHGSELAEDFSSRVIRMTKEHPAELGIGLLSESQKLWRTTNGGVYRAAGAGGSITGRRADLFVIDDPIKGREDADSEVIREKVWNWYRAEVITRLKPGARIVLILCMTGDTRVLRPDGTETELRDIRPGDEVSTLRDGTLSKAKVTNWVNHGPDSVYEIRTTSGILVKANERHPFLIRDGDNLKWMKLKDLRPGQEICRLSGGSGGARHALGMDANTLSKRADIAFRTTTKNVGLMGLDLLQSMIRLGGQPASNIDMVSPRPIMIVSGPNKTGCVQSVSSLRGIISAPIGAENYASITATIGELFEHCCATIATWPLGMPKRLRSLKLSQLTCDFTLDTIKEICPAGNEDVFDIQVEGTENFIANGLVSHNTRWHEDDLAGRLLQEMDANADQWKVISLPAIAESENDALGRAIGDPLWPEWEDLEALERKKRAVGEREWSALYQQRPAPLEGSLFKVTNIGTMETAPAAGRVARAWDLAATAQTGTRDPDWTVGVKLARLSDGRLCVLDVVRLRGGPDEVERAIVNTAAQDGHGVTIGIPQDPGQAGKQQVLYLTRKLMGYKIESSPETGDKATRAAPVASQVNVGNLHVAAAPWNRSFIEELAAFPSGSKDDQVDALSRAFSMVGSVAPMRIDPRAVAMARGRR